MVEKAIAANARELVSDGQDDKALDLLEGFFVKDPKYKQLLKEAVFLSSQYAKAKRDEDKGTVSFDNTKLAYAQVKSALLDLIDHLENENLDPEGLTYQVAKPPSFMKSNKWLFLIGIPLLVLSVAVVVLLLRRDEPQPPPVATEVEEPDVPIPADSCLIAFPDNAFNVLLLPFFLPKGGDIKMEGLIASRLEDFGATLRQQVKTALCTNYDPNTVGLIGFDKAKQIGKKNKARLVVWGQAEPNGEETFIRTRFTLVEAKDTIAFTKIQPRGEKQVDTARVLSIITSNGELTGNIESAIMLALGMVAFEKGELSQAIATLNNAHPVDSAGTLIKNMLLAESYLQQHEPEYAKAAYDSLLKVHPNYWLALNNRAMLQMQDEDYLGAITDLSGALEKRPTDPDMLSARAWAFEKLDKLDQAKRDYDRLVEVNPKKADDVKARRKDVAQKITRYEEVNKKTDRKPTSNLTVAEVKEKADANVRLGNDTEARQYVTKGLQVMPDDPKLIALKIELLLKENKQKEATAALQDAIKKGIKKTELARHSKATENFMKQLEATRIIKNKKQ